MAKLENMTVGGQPGNTNAAKTHVQICAMAALLKTKPPIC